MIIWINPICIDYDDTQEDEYQTQEMAPIFKHASIVLVALGYNHGATEGPTFLFA